MGKKMAGKMRLNLVAALVALPALLLPASAGAAAITPNTTNDEFDAVADATCSLREAIQSANTNAAFGGCPTGDSGTDVITLTAHLADPYEITLGTSTDDDNEEGDFDVAGGGALVIVGQGDSVMSSLSPDRVIDVRGTSNLTLRDLVVSDGDVTGGLIDEIDRRGGNIRASAGTNSLSLDNVFVDGGASQEGGGGIYTSTNTTLVVEDSRIIDNTDQNTGGGIFIQGAPQARIVRTIIDGNSVDTALLGNIDGGGISGTVDDGSVLTISDSEIVDNFTNHTGNQPADRALGGGLALSSDAVIRRSLITGNSASGNIAEWGGGILVDGGAVGEAVTVVNSTIYDNTAGDASNQGQGGGAFVNGEVDLTLAHVTLSDNSATAAAGADHLERGTQGTGALTFRGSLVTAALFTNICEGTVVASAGYNVAGQPEAECGFTATDSTSGGTTGIMAGGPTDNGGITETIGLEAGGRAVDFVPAAECGFAESQDQRGFFRPSGVACDAGAYERVTCAGIVQEGPAAIDCPPPPATQPTPTATKPKKKCKKKKKRKKGKAGSAAAKKKKKKCKKKKRKRKRS